MTDTAKKQLNQILSESKNAAAILSNLNNDTRSGALLDMASEIEKRAGEIIAANNEDLERGKKLVSDGSISQSMFDRLKLNERKIKDIVDGIRQVADLPDPLGSTSLTRDLDEGLSLYRRTCPIGLIAVIFESRPDALPQIASLAIKSGNAAVLKGGKEAQRTLTVLFDCLVNGLDARGLPKQSLVLLSSHEDVESILKADGLIDLIIPRGSNNLVRHIQDNTRIPVLGHADGVCHLYVHEDADLDMAVRLTVDSKTQYPAACNSIETLLVHEAIASRFLPMVATALLNKKVELRLDDPSYVIVSKACPQAGLAHATTDDWSTEYSDLVLSIKVIGSLDEAIKHINEFGSHHTECIVTSDAKNFETFFKSVNSAGVFWKASTRFADGFRYGFGAEVGISTGKLHPRGPVGLDGLVTYKYELVGHGHIVADYTGEGARKFLHRDIE